MNDGHWHDRLSLCQLTLPDSTFEEDLALCAELNIAGLGVDATKFDSGGAAAARQKMDNAGVRPTLCFPKTVSILPCKYVPGSEKPEQRVEELCSSIRDMASLSPATVFAVTGPQRDYKFESAWKIAKEGLREAARTAAECGVNFSLEPMRSDYREEWCFINTIPECLQMIEDIGLDVKITYDTYHLWDTEDVLALTRAHADMVVGVQVADYRTPRRSYMDRVLPGDGEVDFIGLFTALENGGFNGWYDLEVFSGLDLPDSVWKRPRLDWVREGMNGMLTFLERV